VQCDADDEQGYWEMNHYRVLRVFCQESSFEVKGIHVMFGEGARKIAGGFGLTSGPLELTIGQLCAIRLSVPFSLRSKSRMVRWPALMTTGRRIYPSFSD